MGCTNQTMGIFVVKNAASRLKRYVFINNFKLQLSLLVLVFSCLSTSAIASSIPPPVISIGVHSPLGNPAFTVSANQFPYSFITSIEFVGGLVASKGDVYFGIILPGKEDTFTWVTDGVEISLTSGLLPIVRGINIKEEYIFSLSSALGQDVMYTFKDQDPLGMYLIFTLVVVADSEPSNTQNWVAASMAPLFLESLR